MKKSFAVMFGGILAMAVAMAGLVMSDILAGDRLLHTEPSAYAPVVVFEQHGERCMNFTSIESEGRQSCFQLDDPEKMVFEYTRMMTSALFVQPEPRSILIIGLGGGTLPTALHRLLPEVTIDTVELDPAVVKVAQRYFGYEIGPRQRIHVEDGRAFIEQALQKGSRYDMVMLDAFDVNYIPAHLLTVEFLEQVRDVLTPGGMVVANSFAQSRMYERESATYHAVFGDFFNLRAGLEGNRVIIASTAPLPGADVLQRHAAALAASLRPLGIDATRAVEAFVADRKNYETVAPLRDGAPGQ